MAIAEFKLLKCTGTNAATETDTSRLPTFLSADVHSANTNTYPIPVPASGTNYSYECWLRLECTVAPDNYCQTFKFYGLNVQPDANSTPPNKLFIYAGTTGTAATPINTVSSVASTRADTNYYDSSTHYLAIGVVPGDSKINAVGEKTNYIVLQLRVTADAMRGKMGVQPFYIQYEEV